MFENLNAFDLLKEEMDNDEVAIRVNAMHRLRTVVTVQGSESFKSQILPYIEGRSISSLFYKKGLIKKEDDEVLFAIAEELGSIR